MIRAWCAVFVFLCLCSSGAVAQAGAARQAALDRDLREVSVLQLQRLYAEHKYTVTQVVEWYLARIGRYNTIYRALETVDRQGALATAAKEDADAGAAGRQGGRGSLWGVPVVIKGNTSIKGMVTTDGWEGFCLPGHELVAPQDATVVRRLREAGAVILGRTNMPDFAASDTNRSSSFGRTGNAYDVRYSPGGSSGGTVTALTANFAVVGTGSDTANSIRMPSGTSSVVGVLPTRGLVSIAGIAPLDWLLDNTGPIARDVTDAAIALSAMAGEDALDWRTSGSDVKAQAAPYQRYLKTDALKGMRLGVPAFIVKEATPVSGAPVRGSLRPETRAAFLLAIEGLKAAGATVIFDDSLLPDSFPELIRKVNTRPYRLQGTQGFLRLFGPAGYHSAEEYEKATGSPLPGVITGSGEWAGQPAVRQTTLEMDPAAADADFFTPQKTALAAYVEALERLHLDGLVYPSAQMPPPDETMPQDGRLSSGPHSNTGWVNKIGVPAVVVPGGFYASGLPFGLELSSRPWHDGDLLAWAYAYEQATHHRKPPVLVEAGLLP